MIDREALFSDGTEMFCSPMEADPGETVTIRFRLAARDAEQVFLCTEGEEREMAFDTTGAGFDYYRIDVELGEGPFAYFFRVRQGEEVLAYGRTGVPEDGEEPVRFQFFPGFHTPDWAKGAVMYQIFPDRFCNGDPSNDVRTDEYLYLDRPVRHTDDWEQLPEGGMDVGNFYGGDLQGVINKLDYMQDLGVEVLYFNPIFVSPSNHKYDAQDYDHIDPHLGRIVTENETAKSGIKKRTHLKSDGEERATDFADPIRAEQENAPSSIYIERTTRKENLEASDRLFTRLVKEAHARGMRVILDGVFNHCGSFHKWMDREGLYAGQEGYAPGAYQSADSPYRSYFQFGDKGSWPGNDDYSGWWDFKTLPKLNYEESEALQEEILRIAAKWVSPPYCADGWRLDVAADLGHSEEFNHTFWKRFRETVKKANPNALILAEHYGDPSAWLAGDEWDSVMNYDAFMEPVSWFLTGMEKHSDSYSEEWDGDADHFAVSMASHMAAFPMPALLTAMNELDNHDHSRFLTRTNHKVGRVEELGTEAASVDIDAAILQEAVILQMTWPGAPTIYYGDEAGLCGFTDPDDRRPFPWGKENTELQAFYRDAIRMRKAHPFLRTASVRILYRDRHVLGYARFNAKEQIFVFLNNRQEDCEIDVPLWPAGLSREETTTLTQIFRGGWDGHSVKKENREAENGTLHLRLSAREVLVLHAGAPRHSTPRKGQHIAAHKRPCQ